MYVTRNKVGLILVITFALLLTVLVGHSKSKELMKNISIEETEGSLMQDFIFIWINIKIIKIFDVLINYRMNIWE